MAKRTRQIVNQPTIAKETIVESEEGGTLKTEIPSRKSDPLKSTKLALLGGGVKPSGESTKTMQKPMQQQKVLEKNVNIDNLLGAATPNTKKGILKALQRTDAADDISGKQTKRSSGSGAKRSLLDLMSNYPMRPDEVVVKKMKKSIDQRTNAPDGDEKENITSIENTDDIEKQILAVINSNNVKLLTSLKGIGVNRAQIIVDKYQEQGMPFSSINQLIDLGIGQKVVAKMKQAFQEKVRREAEMNEENE